jgi:hypothetical protein
MRTSAHGRESDTKLPVGSRCETTNGWPARSQREVPKSRRLRDSLWLAAFCAGIAGCPAPVRAADPPPAETPWLARSMSMAGGALTSLGAGVVSVWNGAGRLVTPAQPLESMPELISDDDRRFFAVLNAIGLRLSEIKVGGTLVASSSYRLVAAREPSPGDLERGERLLDEYRSAASGVRAGAKERIAQAVIDLAGDTGFVLTAVVIELSPWPSASYEMNARERPPEAAERRVVNGVRPQQ